VSAWNQFHELNAPSSVAKAPATATGAASPETPSCAHCARTVSVLATVIGHQREKGWILVDAGWMAMSQDRGTRKQEVDQGYGLVCDISGKPYADVIVADANQEHGIITVRPGSRGVLPQLAIGERVRILPNHACATSAQHPAYHVVRGSAGTVEAEWPRFGGWQ
jgi:D-serine deaminase-like pyridoxal phosphate-dependent protein